MDTNKLAPTLLILYGIGLVLAVITEVLERIPGWNGILR